MRVPYVVAAILLLVAISIIGMKFILWGYKYSLILPEQGYVLTVKMHFWDGEEGVRITTWLPASSINQKIENISFNNAGLSLHIDNLPEGTKATWEGLPLVDQDVISYRVTIRTQAVHYNLPDSIPIANPYNLPSIQKYLKATTTIQVNHPVITSLHDSLSPHSKNLIAHVKSFYNFVLNMENRPFKGTTDAVTAALLREASCNGKSRLLVALLRRSGIPARLVGGIILTPGRKRTAHQWVEVLINGIWVPFDPTNGHFAYLPANYLKLYSGDHPLFTFKQGIGFRYEFEIETITLPNRFFDQHLANHPLNAYTAWKAFQEYGISLSLLTVVLMLPLGALIISIFRNVIGMQTFGTFLPALIAAASVTTGLKYGLAGFLGIVVIVSLLYYPLEKWHITHNPRMSIMMTAVVSALLTSGLLAKIMGAEHISYLALFPVAVMTITAERMAQLIIEDGIAKTISVTLQTAIVIIVVYEVMTLRSLQSLFLAFPELYLVLISSGLILGRWTGIRLLEYWRFRHLAK